MPQSKKIQTVTNFNVYEPYIEILTYYDDGTGRFLFFYISTDNLKLNGVKINEGDLIMKTLGGDTPEDFYINEEGELIVNSPFTENMSVDTSTGNLNQVI